MEWASATVGVLVGFLAGGLFSAVIYGLAVMAGKPTEYERRILGLTEMKPIRAALDRTTEGGE